MIWRVFDMEGLVKDVSGDVERDVSVGVGGQAVGSCQGAFCVTVRATCISHLQFSLQR